MYKHHPSLVLGFHACEREIGEAILSGDKGFKASENEFDWLGHGMYFWENSPHRAMAYGEELKNARKKLKDPMVIGAVIHLGFCFDLLESLSLNVLQAQYKAMSKIYDAAKIAIPTNDSAYNSDIDKLFRRLDCAVFQFMHNEMKTKEEKAFDTVRGAFWEGAELYPTAGFREKNHIQICVRNPNCIKGYFRPLELTENYPRV
ncbi:hypothetical protein AYY19_00260 [Photobacterium aquimaris]|uniref:Uncharacterized protein n=1 Tax=Photobacterium aquimaris TaxID=512643 RepID=A0A2T3ITE8_9GAMM|nr:hypothetical protein [Photobacterium aquimaris]OBU18356.1 hypothetical protein AYY19_00260 [Photobacterium aquimaris]OBU20778.1 hypothetical protein AYY20_02005 [Photobacterium aquimaris]PSU31636.1 hypothetical protein CTM88_01565 [Photobacterium aquimaris]PSW03320.1 hypothetical protein CTM91_03390 [Photobacterium aquimaris]